MAGERVIPTRCPRDERGNCNDDHCTVCNTWHLDEGEPQTCVRCLGATHRALIDIEGHVPLLPAQAIYGQNPEPHGELKIPGGDALALLLDGSNHVTGQRARLGHDPGPAAYSYPSDPNPPANLLMTWEDDWRHILGLSAAGRFPTPAEAIAAAAGFLLDRLGWAAQHHPAFAQFSHEIRACARSLEQVLHAGIRDEIGVPCIRCDNPPKLRATYADPHHQPTGLDVRHQIGDSALDQGGRRDYWVCPKCHEVYSPTEYLNAKGDELAHHEAMR